MGDYLNARQQKLTDLKMTNIFLESQKKNGQFLLTPLMHKNTVGTHARNLCTYYKAAYYPID